VDAVTLIRYDEVGLKGRNRRFFEGRLRENVARAAGLTPGAVGRERGRLYLRAPDGAPLGPAARAALARVFGVRSFSPAARVPAAYDDVLGAVLDVAGAHAAAGDRSFAIASRRSLKSFPFSSLELNVRLGRAVQDRHPGLRVDLGRPDVRVHVEVRESGAYVYDAVLPGPGGLPVGTAGRALLLLSGGIDSPVAGWMGLKRGLSVDFVHFHTPPYTSAAARDKAVALAREVAAWRGPRARVHLVSLTAAQSAIGASAPERLWTVLLRRTMLRAAEAIARRDGHGALLTGDSLGQVASQTLENLAAADAAVTIPVLRPLLCLDKAEIVELARRIGTFELSTRPFEDCCVLFAPRRPETHAHPDEAARAEAGLPVEELVAAAVEDAETVDLGPRARTGAPTRGGDGRGVVPRAGSPAGRRGAEGEGSAPVEREEPAEALRS
jgi:thiamine biosynthesis protein ThiI